MQSALEQSDKVKACASNHFPPTTDNPSRALRAKEGMLWPGRELTSRTNSGMLGMQDSRGKRRLAVVSFLFAVPVAQDSTSGWRLGKSPSIFLHFQPNDHCHLDPKRKACWRSIVPSISATSVLTCRLRKCQARLRLFSLQWRFSVR